MPQNILVINSGSSSIKFSVFNMETQQETASGLAEQLGTSDARLSIKIEGQKSQLALPDGNYTDVLKIVMQSLSEKNQLTDAPIAIGHRVVHGGESFSNPVIVTNEVREKIEHCIPLAPLHNPANLAGIDALAALYPDTPQVAVFDTAFHQTLPPEAYLYALPYELYEQLGVRRYGFHGVSHQYVTSELANRLNLPKEHGILSAHLGNGCSACAVQNGRSVDTTMGLTPLEGLCMGTRSGDVDPSLHLFLKQQKGWSLEQITQMLNKDSGILGLSKRSNDMRTVEAAASDGDQQAQLALDVFCFRLARQLSALAASLKQIDALVFTGGIGENSSTVRQKVVDHLAVFGFSLNAAQNDINGGESGLINTAKSPTVAVINTQEEWMIAHASLLLVTESQGNKL